MNNTIKLSLISVALLSQLHAKEVILAPIEVSASLGTDVDKKNLTDSMTIITKDQLNEARITNLADALNRLGGIAMTQNGGPGKATSMFIRGMDTKRLLVLIDGVRYNNPTAVGAAAEFSQIMLYNVKQIEIIKGAQSGVWGADASGGVINIITSTAKKGLHARTNLEYGSFNTKIASLTSSYATEKFNILIGGSYYDNDGYSAVEPIQGSSDYGKRGNELGLEKDPYKNRTLHLKLGYNITKQDKVKISAQTIDATILYDTSAYDASTGGYVPTDSTLPKTILSNKFYTLAFQHSDDTQKLNLLYNLSTFKRDITSTYGNSTYEGSVKEIKFDDKISYATDSFLRVGASYQKFEQLKITANTNKSYSATSAFASNYNKFAKKTILTESIRYDKYNNFDDALTGKIGVKHFITGDFYLSSNIGTGFNPPTLGQLYGQWGANPNLKPERSLTSDVSIGNDTIWITGFYNEITDLITYTSSYVQIAGTSKFKGVELGYKDYFFDALGVDATYTYLKTEDVNGKALARRPKHQVDTNIIYYVSDALDLGLHGQYIGQRYDLANDKGAQTGKYIVANFVTNYKVNSYTTLYAKINNITDKYYQIVNGYATAGRSYYIGLSAKY